MIELDAGTRQGDGFGEQDWSYAASLLSLLFVLALLLGVTLTLHKVSGGTCLISIAPFRTDISVGVLNAVCGGVNSNFHLTGRPFPRAYIEAAYASLDKLLMAQNSCWRLQ